MKRWFLSLLLISLFLSNSVNAEITKKDLDEMETRLKDYIDLKISALQNEFRGEIKRLETKIDERFNAVDERFNAIDKRIDDFKNTLTLVSGILISIFVATLALPQILAYFSDRRERRKIKGVEISAQEFAELKAQVKALIEAQQTGKNSD